MPAKRLFQTAFLCTMMMAAAAVAATTAAETTAREATANNGEGVAREGPYFVPLVGSQLL